MASVIIYSTMSMDGYIARPNGDIDWLFGGDDGNYQSFYDTVDVLFMGRKTYEQVLTFGDWPYAGKQSYVFTHADLQTDRDDIKFVSGDPGVVLDQLADDTCAWAVGGEGLTTAMLEAGQINEMRLFVLPILIGDGIPMFPRHRHGSKKMTGDQRWQLVNSAALSEGLVELHYRRK